MMRVWKVVCQWEAREDDVVVLSVLVDPSSSRLKAGMDSRMV